MKKAFVFILKTIGVLLGIVGLYIVLGLVLPLIKVPAEETSDPKTIPMYIYTNGMHTDLVVPFPKELISPMWALAGETRDFIWIRPLGLI